jgi:hypothetical protein
MPQPTVIELIKAHLALLSAAPQRYEWFEDAFIENPVRAHLLQRLQALAKAVGVDPKLFAEPQLRFYSFYQSRPAGWAAGLVAEIESFVSKEVEGWGVGDRAGWDRVEERDLETVFVELLRFIETLDQLRRFNGHWFMSGSAGAQFSIRKTKSIIASVDQDAADQMMQLLGRFLDPAGHTFTQDELVTQFGYPTEDLAKLEAENF